MKTTNPLANLFQAAMGQCSTLPADAARNQQDGGYSDTASRTSRGSRQQQQQQPSSSRSSAQAAAAAHAHARAAQARHYARVQQQQEQQQQKRDDSDVVMTDASDSGGKAVNVAAMVATAKKSNKALEPYMNGGTGGGAAAGQKQMRSRSRSSSRRRLASQGSATAPGPEAREPTSSSSSSSVIRPPDGSEKKRCYRLNLEVPSEPSVDPATGQPIFGPLIYEPPPHHVPGGGGGSRQPYLKASSWHSATAGMHALQVTNSVESEGSKSMSDVAIAISTAQIFRGITVDSNGTILTQNARASRSARKNGDKTKVGEKSRQAAKIDKAKDLVDEDGPGGLDPDSKTQCLYIMGEYDDMKYLVKDGAKKLRDATNLTDEALLSINRQRTSSQSFSNPGTPMSNRKRISPYPTPTSARTRSSVGQTSGSPPKLKANPRDSRSSRRMAVDPTGDCIDMDENTRNMQCNEIGLAFGKKKGGDWSEALNLSNIWNCGAQVNSDGTMSPTNPAASTNKKMNPFAAAAKNACGAEVVPKREGRNESPYGSRGDGRAERVDAMGNVVA